VSTEFTLVALAELAELAERDELEELDELVESADLVDLVDPVDPVDLVDPVDPSDASLCDTAPGDGFPSTGSQESGFAVVLQAATTERQARDTLCPWPRTKTALAG